MLTNLNKTPFPWFGGKADAAEIVWEALGDPAHFCEPFAGSLAVLLRRPHQPNRTYYSETVADTDSLLCNFWRAVQFKPQETAEAASWPVSECVPAGTMISTPDGDLPIESIREGMVVLGVLGGRVVETRVIATTTNMADEFIRIGGLRLTGEHPVWTRDRSYVDARDLRNSDVIARLGVDELDIETVELGDEKETTPSHDLRSSRSSLGRCSVRRSLSSSKGTVQRAHSHSGSDFQQATRLLLDSVVDLNQSKAGALRAGGLPRAGLAGTGSVLDCEASGGLVFQAYESNRWWRRVFRIRSKRGTSREVVSNAERSEVPTGEKTQDARMEAHCRIQGANIVAGSAAVLREHEGEDIRKGKGPGHVGPHQEVGRSTTWQADIGGTQSENFSVNNESQTCRVPRNWSDLSIRDRNGTGIFGTRGRDLLCHQKKRTLQRETLPVRVPVYNFQTTTGNYFAEGILVHNCDKHARSCHLLKWRESEACAHLAGDPYYCDPLIAGWWAWCVCCSIGAWGQGGPWWPDADGYLRKRPRGTSNGEPGVRGNLPHLGHNGNGVNRPQLREPGVWANLPHLGNNGRGVNRPQLREPGVWADRPHLTNGQGVNHGNLREPGLGCDERIAADYAATGGYHPMTMPELRRWFCWLSARLRHVRIINGDWTGAVNGGWERVCTGGAALTLPVRQGKGPVGFFMDPPYAVDDRDSLYGAQESFTVAKDVRQWCLKHGDDNRYRIVYAGFTGEGEELLAAGWREVEWFRVGHLKGGMGNTAKRDEDDDGPAHQQHRERLWVSPHCLTKPAVAQQELF